jgi:hypothetical protein
LARNDGVREYVHYDGCAVETFLKETVMRLSAGLQVAVVLMTASMGLGYTIGSTWDYDALFSDSSATGLADSEGAKTYGYYACNWDAGPTPNALMTSFHSWETPATWQMDGGGNQGRIGEDYVAAGSGVNQCIQIHWVAPTTGTFDVALSFAGRSDSGSRFVVYTNTQSLADVSDFWGSTWSWSQAAMALNAGDRVIVMLTPWGVGQTAYNDFSMSATLVPEPMTLVLLMAGGATLLRRRDA